MNKCPEIKLVSSPSKKILQTLKNIKSCKDIFFRIKTFLALFLNVK